MQELLLTFPAWVFALTIFVLRVFDMALGTLRFLVGMRGSKGFAWLLGFFQAIIFIVAITSVINSLDNVLNIVSYAAGYATGGVLGVWLEERMAIGYVRVEVISSLRGAELAERLRDEGFAVTEVSARGKDGMVSLLNVAVLRKRVSLAAKIIGEVDEDAFVTTEEMRAVRRGFWRA
ncbi:MAG: DUF2179 domain-containing protein [Anaerolineae bacterium]|jgi:uncharacterized protein YebE (UPF0316 family)|nr:DUF2179 domain-containing protein [Anaerolineae bacterium]MBT3714677.1 DUF2179 domain-containing protein [Anaerolineae bacterium]MBT4309802.1 DUF2179 domain-containing protein [Anaerolineae bacterium]MBT4457065.1 DUF2179 domain-containing protein [Anaerolineae bacterium]MBT4843201.1 DUF2179 domain-containing protein [Anaerolineae bacterium]